MPPQMATSLRMIRLLCYALTALAGVVTIHRCIAPLAFETNPIKPSEIKDADRNGARVSLKPDHRADDRGSRFATVLEDGRLLPFWVPSIADVAAHGHGRFCITGKNIWFSATDGSDPRTNAKRYALRFPAPVSRSVWITLCGGALGLWIALIATAAGRSAIAGDWQRAARCFSSPAGFWSAIALISASRFMLAGQDEVIATSSDPEDFVRLASQWHFGAPATALSRLPVYPLFLAVIDVSGIPLRIAIEIVQLFCFALFATGCVRIGVSRIAGIAVFASLALAPQTMAVNDFAFSDSLYAPMLIGTVGLGFLATASRSWWMPSVCGLMLGLLINLREEGILIIGLGVLLMMMLAVAATSSPPNGNRFPFAPHITALLLAAVLVSLGFSLAFFSKTGVWAKSRLSTPGIAALMRGFHEIPRANPPRRFFIVDAAVRRRAYALSPFLRQHCDDYENDPVKAEWIKHAGVGDLSGDFLIWRSLAVFADASGGDLREAETRMKTVGRELSAGLGSDKQRVYWAAACSVNDTALAVLADHWPSLVREAIAAAFGLAPGQIVDPAAADTASEAAQSRIALYNRVANRRSAPTTRLDTTGVIRSRSIQAAWESIHRIHLFAIIALGIAIPAAAIGRVATRRGKQSPHRWWADLRIHAIALLAYVALTKLLFASLIGVYFAIVPRYMLPLSLSAIPLLILFLDRLLKRPDDTLAG